MENRFSDKKACILLKIAKIVIALQTAWRMLDILIFPHAEIISYLLRLY